MYILTINATFLKTRPFYFCLSNHRLIAERACTTTTQVLAQPTPRAPRRASSPREAG